MNIFYKINYLFYTQKNFMTIDKEDAKINLNS